MRVICCDEKVRYGTPSKTTSTVRYTPLVPSTDSNAMNRGRLAPVTSVTAVAVAIAKVPN
jgi:hypothetical protein